MKHYLNAFKNYANFKGRASRAAFWSFFIINLLVNLLLDFSGMYINFPVLGNVYSLLVLVPAIAVSIRRAHDVNKKGWFLLIPIYNLMILLKKSDQAVNSYG